MVARDLVKVSCDWHYGQAFYFQVISFVSCYVKELLVVLAGQLDYYLILDC